MTSLLLQRWITSNFFLGKSLVRTQGPNVRTVLALAKRKKTGGGPWRFSGQARVLPPSFLGCALGNDFAFPIWYASIAFLQAVTVGFCQGWKGKDGDSRISVQVLFPALPHASFPRKKKKNASSSLCKCHRIFPLNSFISLPPFLSPMSPRRQMTSRKKKSKKRRLLFPPPSFLFCSLLPLLLPHGWSNSHAKKGAMVIWCSILCVVWPRRDPKLPPPSHTNGSEEIPLPYNPK